MKILLFISIVIITTSCSITGTRLPSSQTNCTDAVELILKKKLTTIQKARAINNLEGNVKGSFAEIGAGQGISSKFFEAKRASETIVKSISAYGKEESDRLYGPGVRYVSEQRLDQMLEIEFNSLRELKTQFSKKVKLFSLGNTVTTNVDGSGHGWLGIKFADMANPRSVPQKIKIHLNFGKTSLDEQHKELGKLGVNLVHYLFANSKIPQGDNLIKSLFDGVKKNTINLDSVEWTKGMRKVGTPAIDLVDSEVSEFVIFNGAGKSLTGKDLFYRKNVFAFNDGQVESTSSQYLNLRIIDWPKLLQKFDNNKEKAIGHVRAKIRKGDHVALVGKNGHKKLYDHLSSSMNTSNLILMEPASIINKTPAALKRYFLKMRESKLTPAIKLEDLEALPNNLYRLLKDLEARNIIVVE